MRLFIFILIPFLINGMEGEQPRLAVIIPHDQVVAFVDIESFDINQDGMIDEQEEAMARFAIKTYLQQHSSSYRTLLPALRKRIHRATDSPGTKEAESVSVLRRMMSGERFDRSDYHLAVLQNLILNATSEALQVTEAESDKKVTKKKATSYAVASSTLTACLTIGAMLLIHFTDGNCN